MFLFFNNIFLVQMYFIKLTPVGNDRVQANDICETTENCDRFLGP